MHGVGHNGRSWQNVSDANSQEPPGLLLPAIDHLTEEKLAGALNLHPGADGESLVEPDLGAAFAGISNLAVKKLTRSKYADNRGLMGLVAWRPSAVSLLF